MSVPAPPGPSAGAGRRPIAQPARPSRPRGGPGSFGFGAGRPHDFAFADFGFAGDAAEGQTGGAESERLPRYAETKAAGAAAGGERGAGGPEAGPGGGGHGTVPPPAKPAFNPGFFGDIRQRPNRRARVRQDAPPPQPAEPHTAPAPADVPMEDARPAKPADARDAKPRPASAGGRPRRAAQKGDFNFVPTIPAVPSPAPPDPPPDPPDRRREPPEVPATPSRASTIVVDAADGAAGSVRPSVSPPPLPGSFPASPPYVDAEDGLNFDAPGSSGGATRSASPSEAPPAQAAPLRTPAATERSSKSDFRQPKMARTTVPSPPFLGADFVPRDWARPDLSGEGSAPPAEGERTRTAGASASAPAKAEAQAGASHAPEAASAPGKNNAAPAPVPPAAAFPRTSPQPAFGTPGLGFPTTTFSRPPGSVYTADATPAARAKAKDDINFVFTPPPNFKPAFGGAPGAGSPVFGRPSKLESALGRSPSQAKSGPDEDVEMAAASPIGPAPQPAKEPERASGPAAEAPAVPASSAFTFEVPSPSAAAQNEPPKFQKTVFPWGSFFGEPSPASPGPLSPDRPSAVPAPTPPKPSIAPTPPKPQPPPNMDEFRTPVAPPPRAAEERRPEPPKVSPKEQERMRAAVMRKDGDALMRAKRYAEAAEKYTEALASPFLDDLQLCLLDRSAAYLAQHKWGAGLRDAADALEHLLALPILDQKLLGHAYDAAQRAAQAFTALGKVDDAVSALRRTVDRAKHPGASAAADPRRANKLDEQLRTLLSIQADLRAHDRELLQGRYPAALDLIEAAMRRINHFLPAGRIPPSQNLGHVVPFDWIVRRAALYVASCRFAEAEAAFTAALQVDPTSAGILYLKAVAYYVRDPDGGSLSAVEADLARALQFDPEHAASRSFLRDVVRSVERNNTAAKAKYAKGDAASVAAAKGMWEAALATLDSIGLGWKEEAPDDGDAADPRRVWRGGIVRVKLAGNLASALLKMGKTAESIAQRKGALAMLLAVAFPGSRDRSAITAGEMARTPYRDLFARTYALLAEAYEKDGSTQESVDAWQRALDVDPRKPEFAQGLSRAKRLLARASKTTYYSVLGVARDATQDQIKKAYRQMALQVHPDKQPAELRPQAETKFKHLQEAYETLSSPSKRSDYDYKLRTEEREDDFGTGGLGGMGGFGASAYSAYARRPYSAGRRYQPPTDHEYDYDEDDFFENLFAGAGRRTQGKRSTAYGGSYSGGGSSSSSRSGTSSGARSGPGTWHTPGPKGSGTGGKR